MTLQHTVIQHTLNLPEYNLKDVLQEQNPYSIQTLSIQEKAIFLRMYDLDGVKRLEDEIVQENHQFTMYKHYIMCGFVGNKTKKPRALTVNHREQINEHIKKYNR